MTQEFIRGTLSIAVEAIGYAVNGKKLEGKGLIRKYTNTEIGANARLRKKVHYQAIVPKLKWNC